MIVLIFQVHREQVINYGQINEMSVLDKYCSSIIKEDQCGGDVALSGHWLAPSRSSTNIYVACMLRENSARSRQLWSDI